MTIMQYKHIIWDWNGTLLFDVNECVASVNRLLTDRALPPLTLDRYREDVDFPIVRFYTRLGFDFSRERYEDVAHEYMNLYLEQVKQCRLQKNAIQTLAKLSARGFTHSVLSAYHQQRLEEAIRHFELERWFTDIIGLDDYYAHSKVENGIRWIQQLPFRKEQVLFVGDMLHDFEVAEAMGVACVLLACGHQSRYRLETCGVPVLEDMDQLVAWLDTLRTLPA